MSKKKGKKNKLSAETVISLVIQGVIAIASIITAIKA